MPNNHLGAFSGNDEGPPGVWKRDGRRLRARAVRVGQRGAFIVVGDGGETASYPGRDLFNTIDSLVAQRRIPPIIAVRIAAGGQDAQGSERGREYDTVSGAYAEWIEHEVLPLVEKNSGAKLTKDPDGRATIGISSSGVAAFTMACFHPELYRRVLAYSPTIVNQQCRMIHHFVAALGSTTAIGPGRAGLHCP